MDFLRSVGLEELPEQQTKMMHLMEQHPEEEFNLQLGFDACCTCGTPFQPSSTVVDCPSCQRVSYCSEACRQQDAASEEAEEETETAMGHSSIICTLLRLCNNDEAVNEEVQDDEKTKTLLEQDPRAKESAIDRVRSEYESYPATIANVLLQGPLYGPAIQKAAKHLVIHIIGASSDGELWKKTPCMKNDDVWSAYAEALSELAETQRLDTIELHFIGPECPQTNIHETRPMKTVEGGTVGILVAHTHLGSYNTKLLQQHEITKADIVVFHNPGFTCPEYRWVETLRSVPKGTHFLLTTNTEMEGIADCQFLLDNDLLQTVPPNLADMFGSDLLSNTNHDGNNDDDNNNKGGPFFNENPFSGNRVRQSGTMGNDVFVMNHWMLGGVLDSQTKQPPNKRRATDSSRGSVAAAGRARDKSKASNPALI